MKYIQGFLFFLHLFFISCTSPNKENSSKTQKEEPPPSWEEEMERIKTVAQEHPTSFEAFLVACSPRMSGDISPCIPVYDIVKHTSIDQRFPTLKNSSFSGRGRGVDLIRGKWIQCHLVIGIEDVAYDCLLTFDKKGKQQAIKYFKSYCKDCPKDELIALFVSGLDTTRVLYKYAPEKYMPLMVNPDNCQKGERWIVTQEGKFKLLEEFTCPEEDR